MESDAKRGVGSAENDGEELSTMLTITSLNRGMDSIVAKAGTLSTPDFVGLRSPHGAHLVEDDVLGVGGAVGVGGADDVAAVGVAVADAHQAPAPGPWPPRSSSRSICST